MTDGLTVTEHAIVCDRFECMRSRVAEVENATRFGVRSRRRFAFVLSNYLRLKFTVRLYQIRKIPCQNKLPVTCYFPQTANRLTKQRLVSNNRLLHHLAKSSNQFT